MDCCRPSQTPWLQLQALSPGESCLVDSVDCILLESPGILYSSDFCSLFSHFREVVLNLRVKTTLGVKQPFHRSWILYLYVTVHNNLLSWSGNWDNLMIGITTTWGTLIKCCSIRKIKKHCLGSISTLLQTCCLQASGYVNCNPTLHLRVLLVITFHCLCNFFLSLFNSTFLIIYVMV